MRTWALAFWIAVSVHGQSTPAALSDAARELAAQKRFEEAEKLWLRAIDSAPGYFPALFNLGYFYFSLEKFTLAEQWLNRAVDAEPRDFNSR